MRKKAKDWESRIKEGKTSIIVVEAERGRIVGFAVGGPERSGNPVYKGELYAIYIIEEYQQQGIGNPSC